MEFVKSINKILGWFEIRPQRILFAVKKYISYCRDFRLFSANEKWVVVKYPCLFDRDQAAGTLGEYFFQDIYVAKRVIELNPRRHVDVGSRVDGFIAHLACTRSVEVLDIRPLTTKIEGIKFWQVDVTSLGAEWHGVADCVSCLHALEHFGLGRYGDNLDTEGWKTGLSGLQMLMADGGVLWLSVPIGKERVEFNAHRVFSPWTIHNLATSLMLYLEEFMFLSGDEIRVSSNIHADFCRLSDLDYHLGLFKFKKRIKTVDNAPVVLRRGNCVCL